MALDWKTAYAAMHAQNEAAFPAAALHYVLQLCLQLYRARSRSVSPAELLEEFHRQTRREFGPLRRRVMEEWGLNTPRDFGRAVLLLARHGCLTLDPSDTLEAFAAWEAPA